MTRLILPLVLLATLALSGCAPDTSAAYKNCVDDGIDRITDALNSDRYLDRSLDIADRCRAQADADPVAFNEEWR